MEYAAKITTEDRRWLVEFPDCPGCQTFGDTKAEALAMASEALEGWLEAHLEYGDAPPRPRRHRGVPIAIRQRLAVAMQIRWLRADLGLSQRELAAKAGVSQQQIAKLEKPSGNPTIGTLEAIAKNSGAQFSAVLSAQRAGRQTSAEGRSSVMPSRPMKRSKSAERRSASQRRSLMQHASVVRTPKASKRVPVIPTGGDLKAKARRADAA
jgi:predicted RNase H-like HicB family nuclease/transcriptional regulator with XRE-family HTH domain